MLLHLLLSLTVTIQPQMGPWCVSTPPSDSSGYWAFVDALAEAWTPVTMAGGYEPTQAGPLDVPRILSLVSSSGLDFYDANGARSWHTSRPDLAIELRRRSGRSFDMLLHLGYIRADRPELSVVGQGESARVNVAGWYEVALAREAGQLRAIRVEYLQVEDE